MTPTHSIIIPTHNHADLVQNCLESFWVHHPTTSCEVLVVSDGSDVRQANKLKEVCDHMPCTKLVINHKNGGFASAVNTGIKYASGRYITLLNNDVLFRQAVLPVFENVFTVSPKVGVIGGLLLYPDDTIQHAGMVYVPRTSHFIHRHKHKHMRDAPPSEYVAAVTGALFSISRACIDEVGVLNDRYFLSCEDTEYCLRVWNAGLKVYYAAEVVATHLEGYTRGTTPSQKKAKGEAWAAKETTTVRQFIQDLRRFPMRKILREVIKTNTSVHPVKTQKPPIRLEIGSGHNPQPGYKHLDVRKGLPQLDYVCDFSRRPLPLPDGSVSEILANHVIEHISWRKLPFVLREWHRVLVPGGRVQLRTPDLAFIMRGYIEEALTPEHPDDESFITTHLTAQMTAGWWANLKLFSGQDYDANFHHVCFDIQMMTEVLGRYGFRDVRRIRLDHEFSPGELQVEAYKV